VKTLALCILIPLSAVGALVIEIAFLCYQLAHAAIDVLIIGNEKAAVRRRFK
jgi:hypothetical protein